MSESIERTLGELSASVRTLVVNQNKFLDKLEDHDRELSESRGAAKANRWLILSIPPGLISAVEIVREFFHSGHAS